METLANGLKAEVTTTAPCCISVHIVVPADTVKKTYSSVLAQYSQKVSRPGFRAGHTPRQLILSLYGKAIAQDVKERLISQSSREVAESQKLRLAAELSLPEDKAPEYELGKDYEYTFTTEVFADFELPQYKDLDVKKVVEPVADKEVDEAAETFLRTHGNYAVVERAAEAGDMLKMDYTTDADEELKATNGVSYLLNGQNSWQMLREPESLPGITAALVGLKSGQSKDAVISFPADFRVPALQGKTLNYHFTLKEVHGFTPAEQTPELFKPYGCEDLAGMKALLRKRMEAQRESNALQKMNDEILELLAPSLSFPLPPTLVSHQVEHAMEHALEQFKRDGLTEEQIAEKRPAKEAEAKAEAEKEFRLQLMLERVAEAEKLQVPPAEFYDYCYQLAMQSGMNPDEFLKKLSGNSQMINRIMSEMLHGKALAFIRDHVKGAAPAEPAAAQAAPAPAAE